MLVSKIIVIALIAFVAYKIYQGKQEDEKNNILKSIINGVPLEIGQKF